MADPNFAIYIICRMGSLESNTLIHKNPFATNRCELKWENKKKVALLLGQLGVLNPLPEVPKAGLFTIHQDANSVYFGTNIDGKEKRNH